MLGGNSQAAVAKLGKPAAEGGAVGKSGRSKLRK